MSASFHSRGRVEVPPAVLFEMLTDPAEQEVFCRHFGATVARCEVTHDADLVMVELYTEEPARRRGGVDRATIHLDWHRPSRSARWRREDHEHGGRVRISGTAGIDDEGDGTSTLVEEGEITIQVPVLGKRIARKIAAAMERRHPQKCRYWEERYRGRG